MKSTPVVINSGIIQIDDHPYQWMEVPVKEDRKSHISKVIRISASTVYYVYQFNEERAEKMWEIGIAPWTCTCPEFIHNLAGTEYGCKHIVALNKAGVV